MSKFISYFTKGVVTCLLFVMLGFVLTADSAFADQGKSGSTSGDHTVASQVICNVVQFVTKLGLPIMTGVILGSSVMAIFGRLAWPAIAMLIVFTAIFFGAGKLIGTFAKGVTDLGDAENFDCKNVKAAS